MKIQIDMKEIEEAVVCYLDKQGVKVESYDLKINVINGRADIGARIEIDLDKKEEKENLEPMTKEAEPFKAPFDLHE